MAELVEVAVQLRVAQVAALVVLLAVVQLVHQALLGKVLRGEVKERILQVMPQVVAVALAELVGTEIVLLTVVLVVLVLTGNH